MFESKKSVLKAIKGEYSQKIRETDDDTKKNAYLDCINIVDRYLNDILNNRVSAWERSLDKKHRVFKCYISHDEDGSYTLRCHDDNRSLFINGIHGKDEERLYKFLESCRWFEDKYFMRKTEPLEYIHIEGDVDMETEDDINIIFNDRTFYYIV